jgi:hypothetical protein
MFDEVSEILPAFLCGSLIIVVPSILTIQLWLNAGEYRIALVYFFPDIFYRTKQSLLDYRPLEGNDSREFRINSSLEAMRTGPTPWLGMLVDIVNGPFKGNYGAVKDVNRYEVKSTQSGLILTVERHIFTPDSSNDLVKADYDAVRYHKYVFCLCST